jgi:hypothetical protein
LPLDPASIIGVGERGYVVNADEALKVLYKSSPKIIAQKADLEQKLAKAERGQASPIEPLKNLIFEANQAQKWVFENNWLEMKSFLQKVGLNRQTRSQTLTVSFKKHWCSLAETTVAAQRAASESERNSVWWRRRELK